MPICALNWPLKSHKEMFFATSIVITEPYVVAELRAEPEKTLFLGFDSKANAIEVITDTGANGELFVIHANKITKQYEKLLEEVLK